MIIWLFIMYFLVINLTYFVLIGLSMKQLPTYMDLLYQQVGGLKGTVPDAKPPVSVIIPALNEEKTIVDSVKSALQLNYSEHEVIVVDDGSTDETLAVLREAFDLQPRPSITQVQLETKPVKTLYQSLTHPNLRVVEKENGGKSDALNAGLNEANYPLFCNVDADSIMDKNGLHALVQPFLNDPDVVATGGTVRVVNGCELKDGQVQSVGLSSNLLVVVQVLEYIRSFLFGRLGWNPLNGVLIISGTFGMYNRNLVIDEGGFKSDTVTEDMELVLRLHRSQIEAESSYRIHFLPYPVCWTQVPEDLGSLKNQRARWQQGLMESLLRHWKLPFRKSNPGASWISYPYQFLFEGLGPIVEVTGYIYVITGFFLGYVSLTALGLFGLVSVGLGMTTSLLAFLLEELSFRKYTRIRDQGRLVLAALLDNLGYRQLLACFRIIGLFRLLQGKKRSWGEMRTQSFENTTKSPRSLETTHND